MGLDHLLELLEGEQPVLLDGGMGTELKRRFANAGHPLYTAIALLEDPNLVVEIHKEYIEAGVDIIRLNSFLTSEAALRSGGLGGYRDELPEIACELAERAVEESGRDDVVLAATLSPIGSYLDTSGKDADDLQLAQEKHSTRLALSGVEVAFCETMPSVKEAIAAIKAAHSSGMEAVVSFVPSDARHILSGETLDTAIRSVIPLNPLAICLNCAMPNVLNLAMATLMSITPVPAGAWASVEEPRRNEIFEEHLKVSVIRYLRHAQAWKNMGVKIIGGCCGTTPHHIRLLKEKLYTDPESE